MKWELLTFGRTVWYDRSSRDIDCASVTVGTPYTLKDASTTDEAIALIKHDLGALWGDIDPLPTKRVRERVRTDWKGAYPRFDYRYEVRQGRWVMRFLDKSGAEPADIITVLRQLKT